MAVSGRPGRARSWLIASAVVTGLLFIGWVGIRLAPASYRVRMTVEIEEAGRVHTGSSVYQVSMAVQALRTAGTRPMSVAMRGEAVEIKLPGGSVFAVMKQANGEYNLHGDITDALLPLSVPHPQPGDYIWQARKLGWSFLAPYRATLPRHDWPLLVRFRDMSNPLTAEFVDPTGIGMRRVLLETTRDPIASGLEKTLPWLPRVIRTTLAGGISSDGSARTLSADLFSTEIHAAR